MIINGLYAYDNQQRQLYGNNLCGVDEAGRGPLAGPVVVAAVILPCNLKIENLNDSKLLSDSQREKIFEVIVKEAVCFNIEYIDNNTIDKINILNATFMGMEKAVNSLPVRPDIILIDGNHVPCSIKDAKPVIKGDSLSASIAAASILAKVSRDRYMIEISSLYPQYEFTKHKGYATKLHYERINEFGISTVHRKSFLRKSNRYFYANCENPTN